MIFDSGLDKEMWGKAILAGVYLYNRTPTTTMDLKTTPANLWYGFQPDISKIRIFGCPVYSFISKEVRHSKLDSHSEKLILIGYCDNGYRLWNPDTRKITTARHVKFDESCNSLSSALAPQRTRYIQINMRKFR